MTVSGIRLIRARVVWDAMQYSQAFSWLAASSTTWRSTGDREVLSKSPERVR